ncbi:hypothetical protein PUNSTDRAFT_45308 [Punctularia strigosozonata HHB-11173 SS5]|uniref:uncharacterized protein n=1 Tax=Punctularia strigosozonata (strain HHB-11173) TaxID=741275 RepID=UPI0004418053|nr:uncharacterized protein PUNSTDRAFT_45308 [Punctularia strigosozonata HHB-11173 SS5]EIN07836.1 hypothetical protein PUNSTDRAFT_45308 [Punctularia strigosozonata HHB-11173 SS5]
MGAALAVLPSLRNLVVGAVHSTGFQAVVPTGVSTTNKATLVHLRVLDLRGPGTHICDMLDYMKISAAAAVNLYLRDSDGRSILDMIRQLRLDDLEVIDLRCAGDDIRCPVVPLLDACRSATELWLGSMTVCQAVIPLLLKSWLKKDGQDDGITMKPLLLPAIRRIRLNMASRDFLFVQPAGLMNDLRSLILRRRETSDRVLEIAIVNRFQLEDTLIEGLRSVAGRSELVTASDGIDSEASTDCSDWEVETSSDSEWDGTPDSDWDSEYDSDLD